jgi:hypothetical protein
MEPLVEPGTIERAWTSLEQILIVSLLDEEPNNQ